MLANYENLTLSDLALSSTMYNPLTSFNASLKSLRSVTGDSIDLNNPAHRASLVKWLNDWGAVHNALVFISKVQIVSIHTGGLQITLRGLYQRWRHYLAKIVLDLHEIANKGIVINAELNRVIMEAVGKKIALVEIIPGKGSGQLKKRVLRFLAQPEIKKLYHRLEKDDKNFGRVFVHFRH